MVIIVGTVAPPELDDFHRCFLTAAGLKADEGRISWRRKLWEPDRGLAANDGTEIVGVASCYSHHMSVPGGVLPVASINGVGVLPTHRRQGILTSLIHGHLQAAQLRHEPLAALWASSSQIYGRYGFGIATREVHLELDPRANELRREVATAKGGQIRSLGFHEAMSKLPDVYERVRSARPGMLARTGPWWRNRVLSDKPGQPPGLRSLVTVTFDNKIEGYTIYSTAPAQDERRKADHRLEVLELIAATPHAHAALWQHCMNLDLVGRLRARHRPIDDPVMHFLTEPRQATLYPTDGLWLRLVDIMAALTGRAYRSRERMVIGVEDSFCPSNSGNFLLETDIQASSCTRTTSPPDLHLDVATLSRTYLGDVTFAQLAAAGLVVERTKGVIERADRAFQTGVAPWASELF